MHNAPHLEPFRTSTLHVQLAAQREDDAAHSEVRAAVEWKDAPRWGVEHVHAVDLEDSAAEEAESAKAFEATLCHGTRLEREIFCNNLAMWSTQGATLIGDAFGQQGL